MSNVRYINVFDPSVVGDYLAEIGQRKIVGIMDSKTDAVVTMRHMRDLKYCAGGVRRFFARHGFDYRQFLKEGIPAEKMEATGDAMAIRVANYARELNGR